MPDACILVARSQDAGAPGVASQDRVGGSRRNPEQRHRDPLRDLEENRSLWRQRFAELRLAGIENDAPRPGRIPAIPSATIESILRKTTREKPTAATHGSTRTMAQAVGVSKATVSRV